MDTKHQEYNKDFEGHNFLGLHNLRKKERALNQALATREFEIELYWKRTTYFWTLITAILAGFGVSINVGSDAATPIILSCIASVLCWAWIFVNKGSKRWQENWEKHVNLLEDNIIGPLYKKEPPGLKDYKNKNLATADFQRIFAATGNTLTRPAEMSVSKINLLVSCFMLIVSVSLLFYAWGSFFIREVKVNTPCALGSGYSWDFWFCAGFTVISALTCWAIYSWGKSSAFKDKQSGTSNSVNPS
ncbi:MAG: hypothetical protein GX776_08525 [Oxalobacter sp.]|nr:hypothetical protein [Oxalobacter sp.]